MTNIKILYVIFFILLLTGYCEATGQKRALTVWFITSITSARSEQNMPNEETRKLFIEKYSADSHVTVLNLTVQSLKDQLEIDNPEFGEATISQIENQKPLLELMSQFAQEHDVHIKIRFLSWHKALEHLNEAFLLKEKGERSNEALTLPDIAQIGSTWSAYFADKELLLYPTKKEESDLKWRLDMDGAKASLRYTADIRLMFYWKKPKSNPNGDPFILDSSSWETIIQTSRDYAMKSHLINGATIVMPIGFNFNLIHDYIPLIWAGDGFFYNKNDNRVVLTDESAMKIPLYIAQNATYKLKQGKTEIERRLVVFPEESHEDASEKFMNGDYLAIIEPATFISKWYDRFDNKSEFWNYAGIAVPPKTFIGGSDLAVFRHTKEPKLAFDFILFITTNPECIKVLAEASLLPAQTEDLGMIYLIKSMAGKPEDLISLSNLVMIAKAKGREYLPLKEMPEAIESHDTLERFQRLWRKLSEVQSENQDETFVNVRQAAKELEEKINIQINVWDKYKYLFMQKLDYIAIVLLLSVVFLSIIYISKKRTLALTKRNFELKDTIAKSRGFSSSALFAASNLYSILLSNPYTSQGASPRIAYKSHIISVGLQGWLRGIDEKNWKDGELNQIIWQAILLTIDSMLKPETYNVWNNEKPSIQDFLHKEELIRNEPNYSKGKPYLHFNVDCPENIPIFTPFMLEQALIGLLEHAVKITLDDENYQFNSIDIKYDNNIKKLSVSFTGKSISENLSNKLNDCLQADENNFVSEMNKLLKGEVGDRPQIGIIEAWCIAFKCYGGMECKVDSEKTTFSITIVKKK